MARITVRRRARIKKNGKSRGVRVRKQGRR